MASGHIPRGRANAPAAVKPSADITPEDLQYRLLKVRAVLADLSNAPAEANFVHPVFGRLQKKAGLRFMQIHTQHHLLIIKDIIKNTG